MRKLTLVQYNQLKLNALFKLPSFPLMSFSILGPNSGPYTACLLSFAQSIITLSHSLSFMTLTLMKNSDQLFCRMPLIFF